MTDPVARKPWRLVLGGACRRGHPIRAAADVVVHGRPPGMRLRCRTCVRVAHDEWRARGRKPKVLA